MISRSNHQPFISASIVLFLLVAVLLTISTVASAQTREIVYQPLVGIPGVSNAANDFNTYINQLYFLSISLAALLAVIKIIIAGVKYMLTDVVSTKGDAKDDIQGALLGLLLIISSVLILRTINPELTNLKALSGAPGLNIPATASGNNTVSETAAAAIAPIRETTNASGARVFAIEINPADRWVRDQNGTVSRRDGYYPNNQRGNFPLISQSDYTAIQQQTDRLRDQCGTGTTANFTSPQYVIVNSTSLNRAAVPLYTSVSCSPSR